MSVVLDAYCKLYQLLGCSLIATISVRTSFSISFDNLFSRLWVGTQIDHSYLSPFLPARSPSDCVKMFSSDG